MLIGVKANTDYPGVEDRGITSLWEFTDEPDERLRVCKGLVSGGWADEATAEDVQTWDDFMAYVVGNTGASTYQVMDDVTYDGEESALEKMASGVISKADEERQIVYGWAYVTHDKDGQINFDKSGEFVDDIVEIDKAAVKFMLDHRATDAHHTNVKTGDVVESMVFTAEKIEKMGLSKDAVPLGWWIGTKVDDATWAEYKAGRLKSFSVHGKGTRKAVED